MRKVTFTLGRHEKSESNIQKVSYFYALTDKMQARQEESLAPTKQSYAELLNTNSDIVAAFNYTPDSSSAAPMSSDQGSSDVSQSNNLSWGLTTQGSSWDTLTVLRREVWEEQGQIKGEKYFSPVLVNKLVQGGGFIDYNVSNNRTYQYIFYPFLNIEAQEGKVGWSYSSIVSTKWDYWSITELHPTDDRYTFEANAEDVWLFKYNLTPSAQKHNFSKTEQKNLSAYPKFSLGTQNNISGDVSCLLGREFISQNFITQKKIIAVQKLYSVDENLIYWTSQEFQLGHPVVSQKPNMGLYSFGNNQIVFWCAKNFQEEPQDINSANVEDALKLLKFNYYGSIQYYIDKDAKEVSPIFSAASIRSQNIQSTNTVALQAAWKRERALMDDIAFWSVYLPEGTMSVPTLTPLASLYYATPGYQLGEPNGTSSKQAYGVYLKRYINEEGQQKEELVFWFGKNYKVTDIVQKNVHNKDMVIKFLSGKYPEQALSFTANGYFQNSNLGNILTNSPDKIVDLDTRPAEGEDWKDAYDKIMPDEHTYAHFYGFYLDESIPGTSGKIEKLELQWDNNFIAQEQGGYVERLPFCERLTSNESIDMLNAWRKVCHSGNPKLLKDNKGQKFLVQIISSSNTPSLSTGQVIPDKIDFSWVEIGSADNIVVTGSRMEV